MNSYIQHMIEGTVRQENYEMIQQTELEELQATVTVLKHKTVGAQIVHIGNEDTENCFALSLRTYPSSSDGIAHILEHVALCGSEKYPLRDPFFEMTRRSLCTFMNAFTCPDYTCYPACTQNEKDFYNLLSVYLDAVFFPKLTRESFLQEGHRLAFDKLDDPTTRLKRQGVVFNEMKGEAACPDGRLARHLMKALFPDLPYQFDSGGDPQEIPKLTHTDLKAFHHEFYHPSRTLFYFYGNLPLEKHLAFLDQNLFFKKESLPPLPYLKLQPRREAPIQQKHFYPVAQNEEEEKATFAFGWLTAHCHDLLEVTALEVLDILLTATDASPLTQALLETGLCKQVESLIETDLSEVPYHVTCRGCKEGAGEALFARIEKTFEEVKKEGFTEEQIEGALHQVELDRLEITNHGSPYGLTLFFKVAAQMQHGGNPIDALCIRALFKNLREKLRDSSYLPSLIDKYFLKNPHRVDLTLLPSKKLGAEEEEHERRELDSLKNSLSNQERAQIVQDSLKLYELQESEEENLHLLPKIQSEDLCSQEKHYNLDFIKGKLPLYHHDCHTNGFVYANLVFALPDLSVEELPYLRLAALFLPQVGTEKMGHKEHLQHMLNTTGGIKCWVDTNCQAENPAHMCPVFTIRGKALERHTPHLFSLFKDIIECANFKDRRRLKELLFQHLEFVEGSIHSSPLRYATTLASSSLSSHGAFNEGAYGLTYYSRLKEIVEEFTKRPESLIQGLTKIYHKILRVDQPDLILSCKAESAQKIIDQEFYGLGDLTTHPAMPWKGAFPLKEMHSQGRLISSRVGFTVQLFPSIPFNHPDSASLSLAAEILTATTLHKKVREQGGAYGSEAMHVQPSGYFYLYSYRDPNLKKTLSAFHEGILKLSQGKFNERNIEEAKCSLFQQLDAPLPPGGRAESTYLLDKSGQTLKARQAYRDRILAGDHHSIQAAIQSHLLPNLESGYSVTFGSQEYFDEENPLLSKPLPLYPV
jgi:presequence protease